MGKQQRRPLAPPLETDKLFQDYSSVIQSNFDDLYNDAHTHSIRKTIPLVTEGNVGDIVVVNLSGTYYLYVKVESAVWKRTAALS